MDIRQLRADTDKMFHESVVKGVIHDAKWALEARRFRAAAILTYCGIDTMANLVRDSQKTKADRNDFIGWCDKYLDFKSEVRPTGIELYGARCGLLHANEAESDLFKAGKVRLIGYVDKANKPALSDENVENLILLSTSHFVGIFAEGVLKTWREIKKSTELLQLVQSRLKNLVRSYDVG